MNKTILSAVLAALALSACAPQADNNSAPAQTEQQAAPAEVAPVAETPAEVPAPVVEEAVVDPIKARQDSFKKVGEAMGAMGDMVKGDVAFDAAAFNAALASMQEAGSEAFKHFDAANNTAEGSKAKPEIWEKFNEFEAGRDKMMEAVVALNTAAQSGDLEQIRPAFGPVGGSCKACHESFKLPND